jgi:TP901 family phage tail tape measure protein
MASPAAILSIAIRANTGGATSGILRVNQSLAATEAAAGRTEDRTNKAFKSMARGADKAAAAFETVFKVMAIGGAAGAAAGLAYSVKKAADFEQQLSSLGAVADATGRQMGTLRKQALKAGADTKFSALEAAQAQTELAKGGLTVAQIMKGGLKAALALAAAGEMDLADAATATVNAMKLFNLRGKDSMKVADAFATAANRTTADVKDFAMALSQGGSAAKAAGLSFNETVAYLEAMAEAGIKNSDAGTSMKTALLQIATPTQKAANLMDDLGLKFFDSAGNMKSLVDISGMLRDKMGGLTREQRVQATSTLAGTDGMRGLLALYDAGPKKIAGFEKGLRKQGSAAEVAKKKQDNLAGSVEQLKGSIETLAIQIGTGLLPYLRTAADELTRFANKAGRILSRDDLSLGEKLQRVFAMAKVTAGPWIEKLKAAISRADIPGKLAAVVSTATPLILKAAAMAGVTAAKTFAGAFASSNAWGKLALGVFLIRKLGLGGLLTKGFSGGGAAGGLGGVASMAKPIPVFVVNNGSGGVGGGPGGIVGGGGGAATGAGKFAKLKGLAKGAGKMGAELAALDFAINLVDQHGNPIAATINAAHDLTFGIIPKVDYKTGAEQVQEHISNATKEIEKLQKLKDFSGLTTLSDSLRKDADEARRFGAANVAGELDKQAMAAQAAADKVSNALGAKWTAQIRGNWKRIATSGANSMDAIRSAVASNMQIVKDRLGKDTDAGRQALAANFRLAAKAVKQSMDAGATDTRVGAEKIRGYLIKALQSLGLTSSQAAAKIDKNTLQNSEDRPGNATIRRQRGGPINLGAPSGDTVPAMLERGEYVVNRNAVQKIGRKALDQLNFGAAPRFASGGHIAAVRSNLQGGVGALANRALAVDRSSAQDILDAMGGTSGVSGGPLPAGLSGGTSGANQKLGRAMMIAAGWGAKQWPALKALWMGESGWNQNAYNASSGATGIPQSLPGSKMASAGADWKTNPATQIRWGLGYIRARYGSPGGAYSAWLSRSPHWYARGGLIAGADGSGVNRQIVDRFGPTFFAAGGHVKHPKVPKKHHDTVEERLKAQLATAELTKGTGDDLAVLKRLVALYQGQLATAHKQHDARGISSAANSLRVTRNKITALRKKIAALRKKPAAVKSDPLAWDHNLQAWIDIFGSRLATAELTPGTADDLAALQGLKALNKRGLRQALRRGDTPRITEYAQGLKGVNDQITGLSPDGTGGDPNQPLIDSNAALTAATDAHTAALADVGGELKRQTDLAQQWAGTSDFQKMKFIADMLSGRLGRDAQNRGFTPGAGFEVTY